MRVSGLASQMDIDDIVKKMMASKRAPLDKLNQNRQLIEWRRDSYREINSALADFRYNKLDKLRFSSATNVYSSTVTGNKTAVSAKATSVANQVTMTVEVNRLATQTTLSSATLDDSTTTKTKLGELGTGDTFTLEVSRGSSTEAQKFTFSKDDTIQTVLNKINGNPDANVQASFDEASKKFIIKSKEYGNSEISFEGSLLTDAFKIENPSDSGEGGPLQLGATALVKINGKEYTLDSNQLTINGVELTFLEKTGDKDAVITTTTDSTNLIGTIKSFVENYNSLIGYLNSKTSEQKYKDFPPLTAEQKEKMKEDEIKQWEAKAKSGIVKNDDIVKDTLFQMRSLLWGASTKLGDKTLDLSSIGITTGGYTENGKLYIDEEKLQEAIAQHPNEVVAIFSGNGEQEGVFQKMHAQLMTPLTNLSQRAGTSRYSADVSLSLNEQSTMGKELFSLKTRISELTKRLAVTENNLYKQFTAMEKAINKLNMQSASLANFAGQ
ncbi:flagellar filament capping protein FliD [Paenibacillus sp. GCM10012307]|uniref:Flagellar hook-associated protein 2 n=1 Tax=Paenibacillus roseus TaxID=2798579 RepID=A0A934J268_9BACL|nr:flagellar filament capping protein FliD [Paenibacillus roseus]MBJ6361934.1 flagellar filament capping protein FliD [Paenibacillus roseus]